MDLLFSSSAEEETKTSHAPSAPGYVQVSAPWLGPFNIDGESTEFMVKDHGTHPDLKDPNRRRGSSERSRTIGELIKHWDGQKVWGLMEDGMWRQATVLATVPPKDDPTAPWTFILGTKHDVWRHMISALPVDDSDLEFETIHVAEFTDSEMMSEAFLKKYDFAPNYPDDAPKMNLGDYKCPIHPFVAQYIRRLKHIIEKQPGDLKMWKEKYEALQSKQMGMYSGSLDANDEGAKKERDLMKLYEMIAARDKTITEMTYEKEQLLERISVLDDCLRKTILADSEATSKAAQKHAKQQAKLQAEVDLLLQQVMMLKDGQAGAGDFNPNPVVGIESDNEAALKKEVADLKSSLALAGELDLARQAAELKSVQDRLRALEKGSELPSDLTAMSADELKASILAAQEEQQASLTKDQRKSTRDRIRTASQLKDEINKVRGRCELLETRKGIKVLEKGAELETDSAMWAALTPMVMVSRQELQKMKLNEAKLSTDNAKLLAVLKATKVPTASEQQVLALQNEVRELAARLRNIVDSDPVTSMPP
jgi:hypothetical protein